MKRSYRFVPQLFQTFLGSAVLVSALTACKTGSSAAPGAKPAKVTAGRLPVGPEEPQRGLPFPSLNVPWSPPVLTAGNLEDLANAVKTHKTIALALGPEWRGQAGEKQGYDLVKNLAPQTQVVARSNSMLSALLRERGELPIHRRTVTDGSHDLLGRPNYVLEDVKLRTDWNQNASQFKGASGFLLIDTAELDLSTWRSLQTYAIGDCSQPIAALAAGQEESLALLEPFLNHADAVLWQIYRTVLHTYLPEFTQDLKPYSRLRTRGEFADQQTYEQYECGHRYWGIFAEFSRCGDTADSCLPAPRIFLTGGARIGTSEPSSYIPETCPALVGRDYVSELRGMARESAQAAGSHLSSSWLELGDRLGAMTEVYATLEKVCVPQRRRFVPEDLQQARERLTKIGEDLATNHTSTASGQWISEDGMFHVPGTGSVRQVLRFNAGSASINPTIVADARNLLQFIQSRALCRSNHAEAPVAAMVIDVGSSAVDFYGYFYQEELFCGDLPPLFVENKKAGPVGQEAGQAAANLAK